MRARLGGGGGGMRLGRVLSGAQPSAPTVRGACRGGPRRAAPGRGRRTAPPAACAYAPAPRAPAPLNRDGTSSIVLLIGELMRQSERYLAEGSHPRVLVEVRGGGGER
jgi:hypothetical protein